MYNLLELYSTMPTTKTVQRQSLTPVSTAGAAVDATKRAVTPTAAAAAAAAPPVAKTPENAEAPQPQQPPLPKARNSVEAQI